MPASESRTDRSRGVINQGSAEVNGGVISQLIKRATQANGQALLALLPPRHARAMFKATAGGSKEGLVRGSAREDAVRRATPHATRHAPHPSARTRRQAACHAAPAERASRPPPISADLHRPPPTSTDLRRSPPISTDLRRPPTISTDLRRAPPICADLRGSIRG